MRTYVFRESKASYNCKDLETISSRCSRVKSLTILKKCWFRLQSFYYFHNSKRYLTYSLRRSQGRKRHASCVYEVYTTKVIPEVNYVGVYTANVTPRKQTSLSYALTASYKNRFHVQTSYHTGKILATNISTNFNLRVTIRMELISFLLRALRIELHLSIWIRIELQLVLYWVYSILHVGSTTVFRMKCWFGIMYKRGFRFHSAMKLGMKSMFVMAEKQTFYKMGSFTHVPKCIGNC